MLTVVFFSVQIICFWQRKRRKITKHSSFIFRQGNKNDSLYLSSSVSFSWVLCVILFHTLILYLSTFVSLLVFFHSFLLFFFFYSNDTELQKLTLIRFSVAITQCVACVFVSLCFLFILSHWRVTIFYSYPRRRKTVSVAAKAARIHILSLGRDPSRGLSMWRQSRERSSNSARN